MIKYFQTSTLIILWCLALSIGWAVVTYWRVTRRDPKPRATLPSGQLVVPALVIGPLVLAGAHQLAGVNLLFPVAVFADAPRLVGAALVPALVLLLASGLFVSLERSVRAEYVTWSQKNFALIGRAYGISPARSLRRLVLLKSLAESWGRCLPWLFGELIVVEAVFNAPGIGLHAWHMARTRSLTELGFDLIWLVGIYGCAVTLQAALSRWIGKRLESYQ